MAGYDAVSTCYEKLKKVRSVRTVVDRPFQHGLKLCMIAMGTAMPTPELATSPRSLPEQHFISTTCTQPSFRETWLVRASADLRKGTNTFITNHCIAVAASPRVASPCLRMY